MNGMKESGSELDDDSEIITRVIPSFEILMSSRRRC